MTELEQLHCRLLLRPILEIKTPDMSKEQSQETLIDSAVLLPIYPSKTGLKLIMIKRAAHLRHHPKQIAFAGGKREPADCSLWQTALRETVEELGIDQKQLSPICTLPQLNTLTGFQITPYVAFMPNKPQMNANTDEVQAVLELPLACLLDPNNYSYSYHSVKNNKQKIIWIKAQEHMIWGATANILQQFRLLIND